LILVSQAGHLLAVASDLRKSSALKSAATGEVLGAVSSGPKSIALARRERRCDGRDRLSQPLAFLKDTV